MMKGSIILATAYVLTLLLRRRSAADRHIVWVAAIFSAALVPVFSVVLPSWQPAFAARLASSLPTFLARSEASAGELHGPRVVFQAESIETTNGVLERTASFIWLGGSIVCLFFAARGFARRGRIPSRTILRDSRIRGMLSAVAEQLRCRRTIRIEENIDDCMPMT